MVNLLIEKWRLERRLSQNNLANMIGATQAYISYVEAGKKSPTVRMLIKFAEALEVPICELFSDELKNCPYKK